MLVLHGKQHNSMTLTLQSKQQDASMLALHGKQGCSYRGHRPV